MTAYTYRGEVVEIHDGDTLRVDLDLVGVAGRHADVELGFDVHIAAHRLRLREDVRLKGCNAIELAAPGGVEARDFLAQLIPIGTPVTVRTFKPDKYGDRYDALIATADGRDVTTVMCAAGYAAPWNGQGPKPVPPWPLPTAQETS
jgi:endonuclease YncB( thermonuclease family)